VLREIVIFALAMSIGWGVGYVIGYSDGFMRLADTCEVNN
jgi:hypothetical protein